MLKFKSAWIFIAQASYMPCVGEELTEPDFLFHIFFVLFHNGDILNMLIYKSVKDDSFPPMNAKSSIICK